MGEMRYGAERVKPDMWWPGRAEASSHRDSRSSGASLFHWREESKGDQKLLVFAWRCELEAEIGRRIWLKKGREEDVRAAAQDRIQADMLLVPALTERNSVSRRVRESHGLPEGESVTRARLMIKDQDHLGVN